jgi:hypothetical protein
VAVQSHGDSGSVEQSNDVAALAAGLNFNATGQSIAQSQGGPGGAAGTAVQAAGQKASSDQDATAHANALQIHPSNVNAGVRVLDKPDRCEERCKDRGGRDWQKPKRDRCEWRKGCKLHEPCLHESGCRSRLPDRRERGCKGDESRKRLDPCEAHERCRPHERKSPCDAHPAPRESERRLMPMA